MVCNVGRQPMHTLLVPLEGCYGFPLEGQGRTTGPIIRGWKEARELCLVSVPGGRSQNLG